MTKGEIKDGAKRMFRSPSNPHNLSKMNLWLSEHRFCSIDLSSSIYQTKGVHPGALVEAGLYQEKEDGAPEFQSPGGKIGCIFCFKTMPTADVLESVSGLTVQQIKDWHHQAVPYCKINEIDNGNLAIGKNYAFEAARLKSLLSETLAIPDLWRHVSPKDLASSGFFYIGPQDKVCCYVCNLVVSQWAQGDQAKEQHRLWNPKCSFLTGDRVDDNIPFGEEGSQGQHKYDSLSKKEGSEQCYPKYAKAELRAETFKSNWKHQHLDVALMVASGFFFTGDQDQVICYSCGLCLHQWSAGDDPKEVHRSYNHACKAIKN